VSQELDKQAALVSEGLFPCRSIKSFPKVVYGEFVLVLMEDLGYFKGKAFNVCFSERQSTLKLLIDVQLCFSTEPICVFLLLLICVITLCFILCIITLEGDVLTKVEAMVLDF